MVVLKNVAGRRKHGKGMRYSGIGSFAATQGRSDIHMAGKKSIERMTEVDSIGCDQDGLHNIPLIFLKNRAQLNLDQWL